MTSVNVSKIFLNAWQLPIRPEVLLTLPILSRL